MKSTFTPKRKFYLEDRYFYCWNDLFYFFFFFFFLQEEHCANASMRDKNDLVIFFLENAQIKLLVTWHYQLELSHVSLFLHPVPQSRVFIQNNLGGVNFTVVDLGLLLRLKNWFPKFQQWVNSGHS